MIDERIAERRRGVREDRRRARLRRTVLLMAVVVLAAALIVLERSALVGLEEIRVAGVDRLEADEVREATRLELGTSTLRLRLGRVEQRVEQLPAVRDAAARRLDPLTVLVEVVEREPSLVAQAGGERVVVDREGVVLGEGGAPGVPRIHLDGDLPAPGETVAEDPGLHNAFLAWRGLTGPLRSDVVRYDASGPNDLVLRLESGIRVRFGRADRIDEKVRALGVILEDIGDAEVREIDVRPPSAPVVVP
jgi:cell division septal protein FtsQ